MDSIPTLEYGHRPARRRWVRVGVLLVGLLLVGVGLYFRAPIEQNLRERYAAYVFRSEFDRVHDALMPDGATLWTPVGKNLDADALMTRLLKLTPSSNKSYRGTGPNLVLFVRSGVTNGQRWLAFACLSSTGAEVFTFSRNERINLGYDRELETRQFWGYGSYRQGALTLSADDVSEYDGRVVTTVRVNGGRNVLEWAIAPFQAPTVPNVTWNVSQLVKCWVTARTGWTSNNDWWPEGADLTLLEAPAPTTQVTGIDKPLSVAYLSDGQLAVVSQSEIAVVRENEAPRSRTLPKMGRVEMAAFSPDGRFCYLGGVSEPEWLVPTLDGEPRRIGDSFGRTAPFFLDDRTLIVRDNTRIRRFDCETGAVAEEPAPEQHFGAFVRTEHVKAFSSYSSSRNHAIHVWLKDRTLMLPDIQGRHQMSLSPDGKWLALKGQSGLSIYDVEAGKLAWEHDMNSDFHTARSRIKWSRDGTMGAAAGIRHVYVWSMQSPRWMMRFPHGLSGYGTDVAISPDGNAIAAIRSGSKAIACWTDLRSMVNAQLAR